MSKGGGGGKSDSKAMLEYGNRALDLQKQIYDQQRLDSQPWYQTGSSAVNQLSTLLGLSPSTSASSRQAMFDQYKPQFTTTTTSQSSTPQMSQAQANAYYTRYKQAPPGYMMAPGMGAGKVATKIVPISQGPQTTSTTDTAGLNSYIDNLLAQQTASAQADPNFGSLAKSFTMDDYVEDPGYQFRLAEGQKALERKLNASGKTFSPEAAKALAAYNQDLGSQEYNNAFNRYNINQDNLFNRLATLSGFGQTASGQIANAGSSYANQGTDLLTGIGNAVTASNLANKQNNSSMFNTLLGGAIGLGSMGSDSLFGRLFS